MKEVTIMSLRIALIQMDIVFGDPKLNFEYVKEQIHKIASADDVDVIVLPELWSTGYDLASFDKIADVEAKKSITFLSEIAEKYHINLVAGSVAKKSSKGFTNTMLVFDRNGKLKKEYSKAHLFRLMNEEKYLVQGNEDGLFLLEDERCAGLICYDIRFPEWVRTHMLDDTKVLFVVAEWPKPRIDHWRTLLISRAIENQCYVVACNRIGSDPNNEFGGHSIIVGPWGEVIAEADDEETILYGDINMAEVDKVRQTIPIFSDRRIDLYKL